MRSVEKDVSGTVGPAHFASQNMLRPPSLISQTLLGLLVLFTTACRDSEITTYRGPKDPVASAPPAMTAPSSGADVAPAGAAMAGTPVITAGGSGLTWT